MKVQQSPFWDDIERFHRADADDVALRRSLESRCKEAQDLPAGHYTGGNVVEATSRAIAQMNAVIESIDEAVSALCALICEDERERNSPRRKGIGE
ncbi:hypothetical protein [Saccharopolyspora sp. 6V]|uniref:hypothetical protein n=1 Tax=Saccharopolyspora sp. 6V TaxID=2877239 RepID=UPI001CD3B970|nr:hypothetical protein [Saccharopolyspora sp. 6V]MCA1195336.1 hypothetical protein [Saccharopolyspora sp. 6V]